jgi:hypothetical protein
MFNSKKTTLFTGTKPASVIKSTNPFVQAGLMKSAENLSGNGSLKYNTSNNLFVDQYASISKYKAPRPYDEVAKDMHLLYATDKVKAVKLLFYIRMITRTVQLPNGTKTESVQKGSGLKHEGMLRMMWLAINDSDVFWSNINLFISIGCWKDIIQMLSYDLQYNGWEGRVLDWNKFGQLILAGLENPNTSELVKKYLPQIKSNTVCKTIEAQADNMISKWICSLLFKSKDSGDYSTYQKYRKLKASGTAHQWQQLISQGKFLSINFDTIHGRALAQLVSGKFLANNKLEAKYQAWISTRPVAKYTGFVYELSERVTRTAKKYELDTVNAQYQTLLELAKVNTANSPYRAISVLDGSGSMSSLMYIGNGQVGKMKSIDVAWANLVMLNDMLTDGYFKNSYLSFSNTCEMHTIKGSTFTDRILLNSKLGNGGTNFMSVFDLFIKIKQSNPSIKESEFPNMVVVWSDGEFNNVGSSISNVDKGRQKLLAAGFSKEYSESFGFCFVDMPNTFYSHKPTTKFETFANAKNCFYFSGYDLSPLGFLFGSSKVSEKGVPSTAEELFESSLDQEVLNMIQV